MKIPFIDLVFALNKRTNEIYDGTSIGYCGLNDFSITISSKQIFLLQNSFPFLFGINFQKEVKYSVKVEQRVKLN